MEIDPLKPKTVPLSAETILWFEFLLKPELLITHLEQKRLPDPSPIELIDKFLTIYPENNNYLPLNNDAGNGSVDPAYVQSQNNIEDRPAFDTKLGRKQIALKILSINVVSHLKWDLALIEKNWNFQKQTQLMDDLCTITSGKMVMVPIRSPLVVGPLGNRQALEFATFVYQRWILKVYKMFKDLIAKKKALTSNPLPIPLPAELNLTMRDDMFMNYMDPEPQASIDYLEALCKTDKPMPILTLTSIRPLTANNDHSAANFKLDQSISCTEVRTQVHFDLCQYYLYQGVHGLAREHAIHCRENLKELLREYSAHANVSGDKEFAICDVTEIELEGVLLACGASEVKFGLDLQMNVSILNRYQGLVDILREDNVKREIPFVQRKILELDIEGGLVCHAYITKELEQSVVALNTIRCIVEPESVLTRTDYFEKYPKENEFGVLIDAIAEYLKVASAADRQSIKEYFANVLIVRDKLTANMERRLEELQLFSSAEIQGLKEKSGQLKATVLPPIATQADWLTVETKSPTIEIGTLKRQLISCTNTNTLRQLLVKLVATNPTKPLWQINPSWIIPDQLKSILISLSRGFIQDFAYILLGKSREAASKFDYPTAINMLQVLRTETQRPEYVNVGLIVKLGVLVGWEMLLVQIQQMFHDWPKKGSNASDLSGLAVKCKQCLAAMANNTDGIVPRTAVLEYCGLLLLNANDLNATMAVEKRNTVLQLASEFGSILSELDGYRSGLKKSPPYAWELVTAMFENNPKRAQGVPNTMLPFVKRLRDGTVFAIVISLLARIHNVLKDEMNSEIGSEFLFLWPTTLNGSGQTGQAQGLNSVNSNYNLRLVSKVLGITLKQALAYHPQNVGFLKQMADLEFANGNNETAMRYYVTAVITATDYCTLHLGPPVLDDPLLRRMIKCCSNMGCHIQAAVLYQFMGEIDYSTAFKCLSEKSNNFTDAMDAYYPCIWDVTMLEFIINMHGKKGEHVRKQQAIAFISQLELNANNSEEIKREAAAVRKAKFMRTLAKQYML